MRAQKCAATGVVRSHARLMSSLAVPVVSLLVSLRLPSSSVLVVPHTLAITGRARRFCARGRGQWGSNRDCTVESQACVASAGSGTTIQQKMNSGLVGSNHTRRTSADRGVFLWILMATTGSGVKAVPAVPRRSSEKFTRRGTWCRWQWPRRRRHGPPCRGRWRA